MNAASGVPSAVRGVRAAFAFLTRVPVGGFPYADGDWKWAAAHAPLVGLVVGGVVGLIDRVLLPVGSLPAAFLALGASMLITGAFHEDGLADTSDALGGAYDPARVLVILKDSRIGSFGGAALVVSIGARAALIAELGTRAPWSLAIVGSVARVAPIWLMAALPYVTSDEASKSRLIAARGGLSQAIVATIWGGLALGGGVMFGSLSVAKIVPVCAATLVVTVITGFRYWRRLGGITGDFLGATEQLTEIAVLMALVWKT
jgi:adenosylcobinamide-GDP ribazoletransferase